MKGQFRLFFKESGKLLAIAIVFIIGSLATSGVVPESQLITLLIVPPLIINAAFLYAVWWFFSRKLEAQTQVFEDQTEVKNSDLVGIAKNMNSMGDILTQVQQDSHQRLEQMSAESEYIQSRLRGRISQLEYYTPYGIYTFDYNTGYFLHTNPEFERLIGYTAGELNDIVKQRGLVGNVKRIELVLDLLVYSEDIDKFMTQIVEKRLNGEFSEEKIMIRFLHKSGEPFITSLITTAAKSFNGNGTNIVQGYIEDLSQEKSLEAKIETATQAFDQIMTSLNKSQSRYRNTQLFINQLKIGYRQVKDTDIMNLKNDFDRPVENDMAQMFELAKQSEPSQVLFAIQNTNLVLTNYIQQSGKITEGKPILDKMFEVIKLVQTLIKDEPPKEVEPVPAPTLVEKPPEGEPMSISIPLEEPTPSKDVKKPKIYTATRGDLQVNYETQEDSQEIIEDVKGVIDEEIDIFDNTTIKNDQDAKEAADKMLALEAADTIVSDESKIDASNVAEDTTEDVIQEMANTFHKIVKGEGVEQEESELGVKYAPNLEDTDVIKPLFKRTPLTRVNVCTRGDGQTDVKLCCGSYWCPRCYNEHVIDSALPHDQDGLIDLTEEQQVTLEVLPENLIVNLAKKKIEEKELTQDKKADELFDSGSTSFDEL